MGSYTAPASSDAGSSGPQLQMPGTPYAAPAAPSPGTPMSAGGRSPAKGALPRSVRSLAGSRSSTGVRSMPVLSPVATQRQKGTLASTLRGTLAGSTERFWEGVPSMPPKLHSEYLGVEAVDRFRLVANLSKVSLG